MHGFNQRQTKKSQPSWNPIENETSFPFCRRSQRDGVYLRWPIAPSYMSPMLGEGVDCGGSASECSCAHGAQINFGDPTPYLIFGIRRSSKLLLKGGGGWWESGIWHINIYGEVLAEGKLVCVNTARELLGQYCTVTSVKQDYNRIICCTIRQKELKSFHQKFSFQNFYLNVKSVGKLWKQCPHKSYQPKP